MRKVDPKHLVWAQCEHCAGRGYYYWDPRPVQEAPHRQVLDERDEDV